MASPDPDLRNLFDAATIGAKSWRHATYTAKGEAVIVEQSMEEDAPPRSGTDNVIAKALPYERPHRCGNCGGMCTSAGQ